MIIKNLETKIIFLPKNIEIYKKQFDLLLKTKYGYIKLTIPKNINIYLKNSYLYVDIFHNDKKGKTWEIVFRNIINGCSRQYLNRLFLKGVGYKAFLKSSDNLELKIGYSHPVNFTVNNTLTIDVFKNLIIQLNSPLKDQLGLTAASLKSLKRVDVYKGKGILYKREKVNLKTGKKA